MDKHKSIRGKKLTLSQKKILIKNNKNPEEYLYMREVIKVNDNYEKKSLNKEDVKVRYLQFIHKDNGNIINVK